MRPNAFRSGFLFETRADRLKRSLVYSTKHIKETLMSSNKADVIYHGGSIVTMISDGHRVEALAVKDGKILRTGLTADVFALAGPKTQVVDLQGKCLMPGFIDSHSHVVSQSLKYATANLDPVPIGPAATMDDIKRILRDWITAKGIKEGECVIGWGYDDTAIKEQRHPTKEDLDQVSKVHPIVLMHISFHIVAVNSKTLEMAEITKDTPDPGRIQKDKDGEPTGVLEELAMTLIAGKRILPALTLDQVRPLIKDGLKVYASEGITTAQEGAATSSSVGALRAMADSGELPIDVIAYPLYKSFDPGGSLLEQVIADKGRRGRFRLGGIKLTVDGSIQGYTAFLSKPYFSQPGPGEVAEDQCCGSNNGERIFLSDVHTHQAVTHAAGTTDENRGFANMTRTEIVEWLSRADRHGLHALIHTNGDAATDLLIKALPEVRREPRKDLRTTIIHAQTIREDQLDVAAEHGLIPSFFPIHVYFWGDRHREKFLGEERARRICPTKSALDRGMVFTLHHDAPVAGVGMLPLVSAAVNRQTSGGYNLGPEYRITPYQALRAITIDAAFQYFEEDRKGTLQAGKLADMVILNADPLVIDPMKIGAIRVLQTFKEGATVYLAT